MDPHNCTTCGEYFLHRWEAQAHARETTHQILPLPPKGHSEWLASKMVEYAEKPRKHILYICKCGANQFTKEKLEEHQKNHKHTGSHELVVGGT